MMKLLRDCNSYIVIRIKKVKFLKYIGDFFSIAFHSYDNFILCSAESKDYKDGDHYYRKGNTITLKNASDIVLTLYEVEMLENGLYIEFAEGLEIERLVDRKEDHYNFVYSIKMGMVDSLTVDFVHSIWVSKSESLKYDSCKSNSIERRGQLLRWARNVVLVNGEIVRLEISEHGLWTFRPLKVNSFSLWIKKNIDSDLFTDKV